MLTLTSALRRRFFHHHLRLFSTSPAATSTSSATPSDLSLVTESVFCAESDPNRAISVLFHFPNPSYDRYAGDHALRRLSGDGSCSSLLDSFLPHADSEKDFASLLLSYGAAKLPSHAVRAFNRRLSSSLPVSVLSFNALLSAFIKSNHHREVRHIFRRITRKHSMISPDAVSYGLLAQALFRSNRAEDAFAILKQMREEKGIAFTPQLYTLLLTSLRTLNKPELADQLWNEMIENGVKPCYKDYKLKVWSHVCRLETHKLTEAMKDMEADGYKPDVIMYNSLMICYCKHEKLEKALELYKAMKEEKDFSLNFDTFNILMNGLNRKEDFKTGMEVFSDSLRMDKVPNFSILREFVERLAKKGKMEEAKEVIREAKKKAPPSLVSRWEEMEELLGQV